MINICTKYGFDILIISGSYGGHRRRTTDDRHGRRTTSGVWHKLPTGELKKNNASMQYLVKKGMQHGCDIKV